MNFVRFYMLSRIATQKFVCKMQVKMYLPVNLFFDFPVFKVGLPVFIKKQNNDGYQCN